MTERIAHKTGLYTPQFTSEARFEGYCEELFHVAFPDYIWSPFKSEIRHSGGLVHADAALIARDYSRWYVVEVELASHRWSDHIRPQLSKLLDGTFSHKHRQRLLTQQPSLDPIGMERLDIYNPELALVIESATPPMRAWCRSRSILCIEVAPYLSLDGSVLLSLSGDVLNDLSFGQTDRFAGRLRVAPYRVDVPMLLYEFHSEASDLQYAFEVEFGDRVLIANNFGELKRGLTLRCSVEEFVATAASATMFDLHRCGESVFRLIPRSSE